VVGEKRRDEMGSSWMRMKSGDESPQSKDLPDWFVLAAADRFNLGTTSVA